MILGNNGYGMPKLSKSIDWSEEDIDELSEPTQEVQAEARVYFEERAEGKFAQLFEDVDDGTEDLSNGDI